MLSEWVTAPSLTSATFLIDAREGVAIRSEEP
jgi:hypothetical protein